jgi:hypothetical protein
MGKRTGNPRGRPPLDPSKKSVVRTYTLSPELAADVDEYIPEGTRSALIQRCLREEVARTKASSPAE